MAFLWVVEVVVLVLVAWVGVGGMMVGVIGWWGWLCGVVGVCGLAGMRVCLRRGLGGGGCVGRAEVGWRLYGWGDMVGCGSSQGWFGGWWVA